MIYLLLLLGMGPLPGQDVPPKQQSETPKKVRPARSFQSAPPPPPLSLSVSSTSSAGEELVMSYFQWETVTHSLSLGFSYCVHSTVTHRRGD